MDSNVEAFRFNTKLDQTILLGRKARNVDELLECLKVVPESSVYFHTHRFLQQHHYLSPEPPNDFAYWITNVVNDVELGEQVSSVDIVQFQSVSDLRDRFTEIIDAYLRSAGTIVDCPRGEEFHFMASRTFVLATPYTACSLGEFKENLQRVSTASLYYHMFDAKLRLGKGENDFSRWFEHLGERTLAEEVTRLDPYTYTLESLRNKIVRLVEEHDKH
jgi:hypothetical protein